MDKKTTHICRADKELSGRDGGKFLFFLKSKNFPCILIKLLYNINKACKRLAK